MLTNGPSKGGGIRVLRFPPFFLLAEKEKDNIMNSKQEQEKLKELMEEEAKKMGGFTRQNRHELLRKAREHLKKISGVVYHRYR